MQPSVQMLRFMFRNLIVTSFWYDFAFLNCLQTLFNASNKIDQTILSVSVQNFLQNSSQNVPDLPTDILDGTVVGCQDARILSV